MKKAFAILLALCGFAAAQGDTAYLPFLVNTDAYVTVSQGTASYSMTVTGGVVDTLAVPLAKGSAVRYNGAAQGRNNAPTVTGSRGNITLRLPPQSYNNAEITLYSVNGKHILHGKAAASEAANAITRRNVAAGIYLLSVKGIDGNAATTRLTHSGGNMNINVAFGYESGRRLAKSAEIGDWEITVSADGYTNYTYPLYLTAWTYQTQNITLSPLAITDSCETNPTPNCPNYCTANPNAAECGEPTPTTYTVTFDANGGTGTPPTAQSVTSGSSVTLPDGSGLSKSGYTFGGWNINSSGSGTNYGAGASYTPAGNVTLYAKWTSSGGGVVYGTPVVYGGETYQTVVIGTQTWFARNLNYDVPNIKYNDDDVCYENSADSCAKYGRLYNWATAKTACPSGWHLPSNAEWEVLIVAVGGVRDEDYYPWEEAGTKLKSQTGWYQNYGTDDFGFSALPGGFRYRDLNGDYSKSAGYGGGWWSATEDNAVYAQVWSMGYESDGLGNWGDIKTRFYSVRCVRN